MFSGGTSTVCPLLEDLYHGKEAFASREVGLRYHALHICERRISIFPPLNCLSVYEPFAGQNHSKLMGVPISSLC